MKNQTKYDQYLSADRDFQGGPYEPRIRYILCSSPRTGSTLIGQMLKDSCFAGDPLEYFNPRYFEAFTHRFGRSRQLASVVHTLEKHRTSSNGVFGLQMHWSHFSTIFRNNDQHDDFIKKFDKVVLLRRKNKLAQAISLYRASQSKLWSSIDEDIQKDTASYQNSNFDPIALMKCLNSVVLQDQGWIAYLNKAKREFLTVYYEDLIDHWNETSLECLTYITPYSGKIPAQALRKQGPEHDPVLEAFQKYLGMN